MDIHPSDSIPSVSERLSKYGGGGTDCSIPLREASQRASRRKCAGIVLVSDNESWINGGRFFGSGRGGSTGVMTEWEKFKRAQRKNGVSDPKLVCIDVAPYGHAQAPDRADILNIGGFSDAVFSVVTSFLESDQARFVREVKAVEL